MTGQLFFIPPSCDFLKELAHGVRELFPDPLLFSKVTMLLPNKRSCQRIREIFAENSSSAGFLPHIRPIGEAEEEELALFLPEAAAIPPAISDISRDLLLSDMIQAYYADKGGMPAHQAILLASALANFLDDVQREEISPENLAHLVPAELAEHWQLTVEFLQIAFRKWPEILKTRGLIDPIERRNRLLHLQAEYWQNLPSKHPVIIAGTTGSMPATAQLIETLLAMDTGYLVLPGLDTHMSETAWREMGEVHPQYGMKRLLAFLNQPRANVRPWQNLNCDQSRNHMISAAMLPNPLEVEITSDIKSEAAEGMEMITFQNLQQEATAIALMLRQELETPDSTACLVTNHRQLARMVAGIMRRWDVNVDDSAGIPMADTPTMVFLRLVIEMVSSRYAPIALLSALKHPFAAMGESAPVFKEKVRQLEMLVLRGVRKEGGLQGMAAWLEAEGESALAAWLLDIGKLTTSFEQLLAKPQVPMAEILEAHLMLAISLATTDTQTGESILWAHDMGVQGLEWIEKLRQTVAGGGIIDGAEYGAIFEQLLVSATYRPRFGTHPRLSILSPLEARLQHFDVMILGSLNQGSWPQETSSLWMSEPMREQFGLPTLKRGIGQAAHDFYQLLHNKRVVMTRATKMEGAVTLPSMWVVRLMAAFESGEKLLAPKQPWAEWAAALYASEVKYTTPVPVPNPPMEVRPRVYSVTHIEKLLRNPYRFYAEHLLALRPLDEIDADPGAPEFGILIHEIFHRFNQQPGDRETLIAIAREVFAPFATRPAIIQIWWPRFEAIAEWFMSVDKERRASARHIASEVKGEARFSLGSSDIMFDIMLKAKADRIEQHDSAINIIDYKTGHLPNMSEIKKGEASQVALTALIVEQGGFSTLGKNVAAIEYWSSKKADMTFISWSEKESAYTKENLLKLLEMFLMHPHPYMALPNKKFWDEYIHLSRQPMWELEAE